MPLLEFTSIIHTGIYWFIENTTTCMVIFHIGIYGSVHEKLQDTRAKVAPVNLIYGSHFPATEATYKVSQNMGNFVEFTRTFIRITHMPVPV